MTWGHFLKEHFFALFISDLREVLGRILGKSFINESLGLCKANQRVKEWIYFCDVGLLEQGCIQTFTNSGTSGLELQTPGTQAAEEKKKSSVVWPQGAVDGA